jgi:hypothetical protein
LQQLFRPLSNGDSHSEDTLEGCMWQLWRSFEAYAEDYTVENGRAPTALR